jgi:hypothetical protein
MAVERSWPTIMTRDSGGPWGSSRPCGERLTRIARFCGGQVVVSVRLQHHAPGRETAQRVAVDRILAGELLLITAERAVQVGQHEPLQLVPDLAFLRYVEHRLFGHASYRSCPVRPSLACAERWRSKVASCRNALG